jgi:hypothetical protein
MNDDFEIIGISQKKKPMTKEEKLAKRREKYAEKQLVKKNKKQEIINNFIINNNLQYDEITYNELKEYIKEHKLIPIGRTKKEYYNLFINREFKLAERRRKYREEHKEEIERKEAERKAKIEERKEKRREEYRKKKERNDEEIERKIFNTMYNFYSEMPRYKIVKVDTAIKGYFRNYEIISEVLEEKVNPFIFTLDDVVDEYVGNGWAIYGGAIRKYKVGRKLKKKLDYLKNILSYCARGSYIIQSLILARNEILNLMNNLLLETNGYILNITTKVTTMQAKAGSGKEKATYHKRDIYINSDNYIITNSDNINISIDGVNINFFNNLYDYYNEYKIYERLYSAENVSITEGNRFDYSDDNVYSKFMRIHEHDVLKDILTKKIKTININDENIVINNIFKSIVDTTAHIMMEGYDDYSSYTDKIFINIKKYNPLSRGLFIDTPEELHRKIINIQNKDEKCFAYCIIAKFYPHEQNKHRVSNYINDFDKFNWDGVNFPTTIKDITIFEKNNSIAVNVFGFDNDTRDIYPLYISNIISEKEVDLMVIENDETSHYTLIPDFNRLMANKTKHEHKLYWCKRCLCFYSHNEEKLKEHIDNGCGELGYQKVSLPSDEKKYISFKNYKNTLKIPFVIYADFESLTSEYTTVSNNNTNKYQLHEACGFCFKVVCQYEEYNQYFNNKYLYRGNNAAKEFMRQILDVQKIIKKLLKVEKEIIISNEDNIKFKSTKICHICNCDFNDDIDDENNIKVMDYCSLSGTYRGAAHAKCQEKLKFPKFTPVIFHNLKGYDAHLIIDVASEFCDKISPIANNFEKYMSFTINNLKFIDSAQFMNESLEKLVESLNNDINKFNNLKSVFNNVNDCKLLTRKGIYPYDYMNSFSKFDEEQLPPISSFYSKLTNNECNNEDYEYAKLIWETFKIKNMGDYHDLYLLSDVLLLSDVFENFRNVSLETYGLDPCHYITSPGLSWDAGLKMTNITLELLTDVDQYIFIEKSIRGGISMISNRYSEANNKYMKNYNKNEESKYIMYLDANNLYGWAMTQQLPTGNFTWNNNEWNEQSIMNISNNGEIGYFFEVDLEYPTELHDLHNDYPLAPEKVSIDDYMLSKKQRTLTDKLNISKSSYKSERLIPNLYNKYKYKVHYVTLKLYLSLGLKIKKIHRVLQFNQSNWLEKYIDKNTKLRTSAKNKFEKDFYKLMNNSFYGKTMENIRNRRNIVLITNEKEATKISNKTNCISFKIFNENLVGLEFENTNLELNKPIYVGASILDLSKHLMYDFYYNNLKNKYNDKMKLLFTDTDSICFEVKCNDFYTDMNNDKKNYDLSEMIIFNDPTNKKVIGKFKDETNGIPIKEFIGLRAKMYSILIDDGHEKKTAKGIKNYVIRQKFNHKTYKDILFNECQNNISMNIIRSENHKIYSIEQNKIGLSCFDSKRYFIDESFDTLSYGHYKISKTNI